MRKMDTSNIAVVCYSTERNSDILFRLGPLLYNYYFGSWILMFSEAKQI